MRISDWSSDVCSSDLNQQRNEDQREDDVPGDKPVRDIGGPHQLSVLAGQAGKGEREENGHRAERADRGRYMRGERELAEAGRHRHLRPGGAWPPRRTEERRVGKEGVRTCRSRW